MRKKESYFGHFVILLLMLFVGAGLIMWFKSDKATQMMLVWAMPVIYVLWGVVHHFKVGDLHPKIVAEYLLIALLGGLVVFSVVK